MDFENYYEILELTSEATEAEISSSFKKLAKKYHPDKNKETKAKEKYLQITKAYEILSDEKAKKAFDAVIKSKLESKKRDMAMDANRRILKEDLELREQLAKKQRTNEEEARKNLQREIERLRAQNLEKRKQEEDRKSQEKASAQEKESKESDNDYTIVLSWKTKETVVDYTLEWLQRILQMFGEISSIIIQDGRKEAKKETEKSEEIRERKKAFVVFKNSSSALHLMGDLPGTVKAQLGDPKNPLKLKWKQPRSEKSKTEKTLPASDNKNNASILSLFSENAEKDILAALIKKQQEKT